MADRPIIFSAPMVRALLAGQKTQTRRILQQEPADSRPRTGSTLVHEGVNGSDFHRKVTGHLRPRWAKGDRLWVRETWAVGNIYDGVAPRNINPSGKPGWCGVRYAATDERRGIHDRPSIHMPRWVSRLTLVVTEVRVERLQDISEADATAEGIEPSGKFPDRFLTPAGDYAAPVIAFQRLWESINGPEAWDVNPWVAAISFTVHRGNIDALSMERAA